MKTNNEPEQSRPQILRQILGVIQPNTPVVLQRRKSLSNVNSNNIYNLQQSSNNPKSTSDNYNSNNIVSNVLNHNNIEQTNSNLHYCSKSSKNCTNNNQDKVNISKKRASVYDLNEAKRLLGSQEMQWSEYNSSNGAKSSVNTSFKLSRRQSKEKLTEQLQDIQQSWKIQKDILNQCNSGNYNVQRHLMEFQQKEKKETNEEQGGTNSVESSYLSRLSNNSHNNISGFNLNGVQMMSQLSQYQQQSLGNVYFSKDSYNLAGQPSKEELLIMQDKLTAITQENQQIKEENKQLQRDLENQIKAHQEENERLNQRIDKIQSEKDSIESNLQGQINSLNEQLRGKTIEQIIWQERYNNLEIVHNSFINECRLQNQIQNEYQYQPSCQENMEKQLKFEGKQQEVKRCLLQPMNEFDRVSQTKQDGKDSYDKSYCNLVFKPETLINAQGQHVGLLNYPYQEHIQKRFENQTSQIDSNRNNKIYPYSGCSFDLSKIYGNNSQQQKQQDSSQGQSYQYPSPLSLRISPLNTQITSNRESSPTFLDKSVVIS